MLQQQKKKRTPTLTILLPLVVLTEVKMLLLAHQLLKLLVCRFKEEKETCKAINCFSVTEAATARQHLTYFFLCDMMVFVDETQKYRAID